MKTHEKKCSQIYFDDLWEGKRNSEIRNNHCNFQVGDKVVFREVRETSFFQKYSKEVIQSEEYTGRAITAKITHVAKNLHGLKKTSCLLTFEVLSKSNYDA